MSIQNFREQLRQECRLNNKKVQIHHWKVAFLIYLLHLSRNIIGVRKRNVFSHGMDGHESRQKDDSFHEMS